MGRPLGYERRLPLVSAIGRIRKPASCMGYKRTPNFFVLWAGNSILSRDFEHPIPVLNAIIGRRIFLGSGEITLKLVEAGGIEPPSEKARNEEPTCVACSVFHSPPESRQDNGEPVRLISGLGYEQKPAPYPTE